MTVKLAINGIAELDFPTGVTSVSVAGEVATVNLAASSSTLASDTDVSITSPADGQVLTYVASASKWENVAPSGGSSADVIPGAMVTPPAPASFTWVNQGTGTVATTGSKGDLFVSSGVVASTPNVKLLTQALPTPPYQFIVGIIPQVPSNGANHPQCGIALYDSVSGKLTNLGFDPQANGIELDKWTNTSTFSATYTISRAILYPYFFRSIVWLRLKDDNTNRIYSVSSDGLNWVDIFSVGRTDFLTPNKAGLYVQPDQLVFPSAMTVMSYYLGV